MDTVSSRRKTLKGILTELVLCFFIMMVLLMMDRSLENLYPFSLYGSGKRIIDLWISFEMHMHAWLKWIIPSAFIIWLAVNRFNVRLGLLLPILAVYAVVLIVSLLTSGYTFRWWNTTELPLMMYLFITMQCSTRRGICRLAFSGNILYSVLLTANAVFILFPVLYDRISGWAPDYFLSADNLTGFPMLFGLLLALLDGYCNKAKIRCWVYIVLFFINIILIHCISAIIAAFIIVLFMFIPYFRRKFESWNFNVFTGLSAALCFFMVAFANLYSRNQKFADSINPLLRLKRSLYVRFVLWDGAFASISQKPILGYGLGRDAAFIPRPETSLTYNAHNAYLQTLHEGGIVYLAAVLAVFVLFTGILKRCSDRKLSGIFSAIVFSELIMMQSAITSWYTWAPIFVIIQMSSLICITEGNRLE